MAQYYLNFPTFFQSVVKNRTNLTQYDAICMLLYGQLREECEMSLTDRTSSYYATGTKNISKKCVTALLEQTQDVIADRFRRLHLHNLDNSVESCRELVEMVIGLSKNDQRTLLQLASSITDDAEDSSYHFLAAVFLQALRCTPNHITKLSKEDQAFFCAMPSGGSSSSLPPEDPSQVPDEAPVQNAVSPRNDILSCFQDSGLRIKRYLYPEEYPMLKDFLCTITQSESNLITLDEADLQYLLNGIHHHDYCYSALLTGGPDSIQSYASLLNLHQVTGMIIHIIGNGDMSLIDAEQLLGSIRELAHPDCDIIFSYGIVENGDTGCVLFWC